MTSLRQEAADRYSFLGMPGPGAEEWRFTDVSKIARASFAPATAVPVSPETVATWSLPGAHRLCFVNGHPAPSLSSVGEPPEGMGHNPRTPRP